MVAADTSEQRLQRRVASELDDLERRLGVDAREALATAYLRRGLCATLIDAPGGAALSDRERLVVVQYALGRRMKDLSRELGLSVRTIETYLTRGQRKLGVHGRAQVVRLVLGRGWLTDLAA